MNNKQSDIKRAEGLLRWADNLSKDGTFQKQIAIRAEKITDAYREILSGYEIDPVSVLKGVEKNDGYDGLVCESGIRFMSMCKHHFLPFYGTASVVYQPGEVIVGLGKIPRLVQVFAKRLQFQELLSKNIANEFMQSGKAKGVYVEVSAKHLCMCHRGPNESNAVTTTRFSLGTLKDQALMAEARELVSKNLKSI